MTGCRDVTDSGLRHLRSLDNLNRLELSFTGITDRGIDSLAELTSLEDLNLQGTHVHGPGLAELGAMGKLRILLRVRGIWRSLGPLGLVQLVRYWISQ